MKLTYKGIDFEVGYDYQPAEKHTRDHQGWEEQVDLISVCVEGSDQDIIDVLEYDALEDIEKLILENR